MTEAQIDEAEALARAVAARLNGPQKVWILTNEFNHGDSRHAAFSTFDLAERTLRHWALDDIRYGIKDDDEASETAAREKRKDLDRALADSAWNGTWTDGDDEYYEIVETTLDHPDA